MTTVQKAMEEEDMDFEEALDYAVDKRKFLILRNVEAKTVDDDENNQSKRFPSV